MFLLIKSIYLLKKKKQINYEIIRSSNLFQNKSNGITSISY